MKTLFNNPIGWSQKAVGSNIRFWWMVSLHIIGAILFGVLPWLKIEIVEFLPPFGAFVLFATIFPVYYLYALKRLLTVLKNREKTQ